MSGIIVNLNYLKKINKYKIIEFKVLLGRKDNGKPVPEKFDLTKIPKSKHDIRSPLKKPQEIALSGSLPTTVDWVAEGATTPVKVSSPTIIIL